MKYWSDRIRTVQKDEKELKVGIVAANNHYAGFGAATANMFRVMSNMSPVEWGMNKDIAIDYETELGDSHRNTRYPKTKQKNIRLSEQLDNYYFVVNPLQVHLKQ